MLFFKKNNCAPTAQLESSSVKSSDMSELLIIRFLQSVCVLLIVQLENPLPWLAADSSVTLDSCGGGHTSVWFKSGSADCRDSSPLMIRNIGLKGGDPDLHHR